MENQLMPDSIASAPSRTPGGMPALVDPVGGQEGAADDATPPDVAKQEKRLNDTEAALKEAQRQLHETKGQIAQMNTQISAQQAPPQQETDILQSEDFLKRFDDDPAKGLQEAIGFERQRLSKAFVEIMDERDKAMEARIQSMVTLHPQKESLSVEFGELSQTVPGFTSLPEETQVQLAKAMRSAKGPETLTPPGSPAGTGYSQGQRASSDEAYKNKIAALTESMFGAAMPEGSEGFPSVGNIGSMYKPATNGAR